MTGSSVDATAVPSSGCYTNTGTGLSLVPPDINHANYMVLVDPTTAFWALVAKDRLAQVLTTGPLLGNHFRCGSAMTVNKCGYSMRLEQSRSRH